MYLRSKLKLQREECLSTEDSENDPSSESLVDAQGDSEGRNEGLNTKTLGLVMGAINHDGDRVAMARASRKEEEQYARTACTSFKLSNLSATQSLGRGASDNAATYFVAFVLSVQQRRMNLTT